MLVETIFMAVTVTLLGYIAYTQYKSHILNELTLISLISFLEELEGNKDHGKEKLLH